MDYEKLSVGGRISAFDQRNGGNAVLNEIKSMWLYANGAMREFDMMGALIDPPNEQFKLLSNIVAYHQARLSEAVRAFDNFKERLLFSDCADKTSIEQLKKLQNVVSGRNAELEAAKSKLAATPEAKRREEIRQHNAEQKRIAQERRQEVQAIRI